jgi:hypothetical protein
MSFSIVAIHIHPLPIRVRLSYRFMPLYKAHAFRIAISAGDHGF